MNSNNIRSFFKHQFKRTRMRINLFKWIKKYKIWKKLQYKNNKIILKTWIKQLL